MADEPRDDKQPQGKKPALPPELQKTKKPALPPDLQGQAKKPTLPPGAKPAAKKPTLPPGMQPAGKKPSLPPQPAGKRQPGMPPGAPSGTARPIMPPAGGDGAPAKLSRKDFSSDQDVRWCPGCGDYAILATVQRLLPDLVEHKENVVFISGIGCSSRFPYYMNTYGVHSIHGRAPAIASGLKASRPELDVWIITGDGDALSIGGNHLIHILRRNLDTQILLFNNQIYGLTKGQYSPTSEQGKVTKSTPYGSLDYPFNPVSLALGAHGTFVARSMDRDPKHLTQILRHAHAHPGTGFVEVYQNCNIFNDGAFFKYTEKDSKPERALFLEHKKPLTYANGAKGIRLDGWHLQAIDLEGGDWSVNDCLVYDETSRELAGILSRVFWQDDLPQPFGIFYAEERPTYEGMLHAQIEDITNKSGKGDLAALLRAGDTWEIA